MKGNLFQKYYSRVRKEGVIKAVLLGLIVGLCALSVCDILSWLFGFKEGLWVGFALLVLGTAASTPVFYFMRFRPTTKMIAKRVDELGLEERVLTMTELEGDDSYIAMKQREDTERALGGINHMLIKIVVSTSLIVAVVVVAAVGIGATTVNSLYYAGVIDSGISSIGKVVDGGVMLSYSVQEGTEGQIVYWDETFAEAKPYEEEELWIERGENGPEIYAMGDENWVFAGWSDGVLDPYRHDIAVKDDIAVVAYFQPVLLAEIPDDDQLRDDREFKGNGGGSSDQYGEEPPPEPGEDHGAGDFDNPDNDMVEDGKTFYGDVFGDASGGALKNANDRVNGDATLDDNSKGGVSDYFDGLQKGSTANGGEGDEGNDTPGVGGGGNVDIKP